MQLVSTGKIMRQMVLTCTGYLCLPFLKWGSFLVLTCLLNKGQIMVSTTVKWTFETFHVDSGNGYTQSLSELPNSVRMCSMLFIQVNRPVMLRKADIQEWFHWNHISYEEEMAKDELLQIVWTQWAAQIFYVLDIWSTQLCNHKTVPYQCDLSGTECILNIVKTRGAHSVVEVQNIIMQDIGNACETGKM
jgi:hypothetical protein